MRSTYINISRKFLIAAMSVACAGVCTVLLIAGGTAAGARAAAARTRPAADTAKAAAAHASVPSSVRLIYVTVLMPNGASTTAIRTLKARNYLLSDSVQVKTVDELVDSMSTIPSRSFACPMFVMANQPKMTMTFRASADGPALAEIQVNVAVGQHHGSGGTPCFPIHFWVRNVAQKALVSTTFVAAVGHLIDTNIS